MDALDGGNWDGPGAEKSYWDYYGGGYSWRDRDDPTTDSYYARNKRRKTIALLSSDIGMIVKGENNNKLHVVLSSLSNTEPITKGEVIAYNYQLVEIGRGINRQQGHCKL